MSKIRPDLVVEGEIVMHSHGVDDLLPEIDARYVNVTGDTMTGDLDLGTTSAGKNLAVKATEEADIAPTFDAANWTCTNGWSADGVGTQLTKVTNAAIGTITPSGAGATPIAGKTYKIVITASAISSAGAITYTYGSLTGSNIIVGTITDYITVTQPIKLIISGAISSTCVITSIEIIPITNATGDVTIDGNLVLRSPIATPTGGNALKIDPKGAVIIGDEIYSPKLASVITSGGARLASLLAPGDQIIPQDNLGVATSSKIVIVPTKDENTVYATYQATYNSVSYYEDYNLPRATLTGAYNGVGKLYGAGSTRIITGLQNNARSTGGNITYGIKGMASDVTVDSRFGNCTCPESASIISNDQLTGFASKSTTITDHYGWHYIPYLSTGVGGTLAISNFYFLKYAPSATKGASSTMTVGNVYGIHIGNLTVATITNKYGIYITTQTTGTNCYAIYTNLGLNRFGDQLSIVGGADRIQLIVKANATQTTNLQEWQNSSGTVLGGVNGKGYAFFDGGQVGTLVIGNGAYAAYPTASDGANLVFGYQAMKTANNANAYGNIAIGYQALAYCGGTGKSPQYNIGIGYQSLVSLEGGTRNIGIGIYSLYLTTSGLDNLAIGGRSLYSNVTGSGSVGIGYYSGNLSTGGGGIFIGYYAGSKQTTAANLLIIDNQLRASAAEEITNSIIYGVMAATPAAQTLSLNAVVKTGGRKRAVNVQTTTYTATVADEVIVCNSTTAFTVTLPAATGSGQTYSIKNINTGTVTIDGNASETIDGETTQTLEQWDGVVIVDYATGLWIAD